MLLTYVIIPGLLVLGCARLVETHTSRGHPRRAGLLAGLLTLPALVLAATVDGTVVALTLFSAVVGVGVGALLASEGPPYP